MIAEDVAEFTAVALAAAGCLLAVSGWLSRIGNRFGVPVSLLFLIIGMLTGSEALGGVEFDRFDIAYAFGTLALVVILFSGGLNTKLAAARAVLAPAGVLATVGVIGIAALTALGGRALGLPWTEALLVGAIVSSTDAAAVFSVLDGVPLRRRVGLTLELESGLNDPVAVILTTAMADNLVGRASLSWMVGPQILGQLIIGAVLGAAIGGAGRLLIPRARLSTPALYPALTLALALIAYGVPTQLGGSGFLSVYVAAIDITSSLPIMVRGEQLIAARGPTRLTVGDHAFVICDAASAAAVRACFGAAAASDEAD